MVDSSNEKGIKHCSVCGFHEQEVVGSLDPKIDRSGDIPGLLGGTLSGGGRRDDEIWCRTSKYVIPVHRGRKDPWLPSSTVTLLQFLSALTSPPWIL